MHFFDTDLWFHLSDGKYLAEHRAIPDTAYVSFLTPQMAFGSHLLGAGMGGMVESVSFVTGVNVLVVLTALLYLASMACLRQGRRAH